MPEVLVKSTIWIPGVQCYRVVSSTLEHAPVGRQYTVNDMAVIGSQYQSLVLRQLVGGKRIPLFTTSDVGREEMTEYTDTDTMVEEEEVVVPAKKASRKKAAGNGKPTKKAAKKTTVAKAKPAKKAAGKTAVAKPKPTKKAAKANEPSGAAGKNGELKPNQVKMLKALLKGEATRSKLIELTGIKGGFSALLGKVDDPRPDSLKGRGYVKDFPVEEERELHYNLTKSGEKAAKKL